MVVLALPAGYFKVIFIVSIRGEYDMEFSLSLWVKDEAFYNFDSLEPELAAAPSILHGCQYDGDIKGSGHNDPTVNDVVS
jgi:hypothetical protein